MERTKRKQTKTKPLPTFPEIVELDLTQWPNSNANLSTMQKTTSGAMMSTSLADVNQSIISGSTIGNAPTASPEFSGLTPMNTGSSGASAAAAVAPSATAKREPYHRNWFLSSSASTPIPVMPPITNQYPTNDSSKSAQASPAASSLNALSTTSDGSYQPSNKRFQQQILDLSSQSHTSVSNSSSSPSSVPSTQIHQPNTTINTNTSSKAINSNGESSHHKQTINNNNKLTTNDQMERGADLQQQAQAQQQQAMPPPKQQQKSSRRTTSLLNLFMSNSQGKQSNIRFLKTTPPKNKMQFKTYLKVTTHLQRHTQTYTNYTLITNRRHELYLGHTADRVWPSICMREYRISNCILFFFFQIFFQHKKISHLASHNRRAKQYYMYHEKKKKKNKRSAQTENIKFQNQMH